MLSISCALLLLILHHVSSNSIREIHESDMNFRVEAGGRTCFFERGKVGQMLETQYRVMDGQHGDLDISFDIIDPDGDKILEDYKKSENSVMFELVKEGDYAFCMDNSFSVMNSKLVFVFVLIDDKAQPETQRKKKRKGTGKKKNKPKNENATMNFENEDGKIKMVENQVLGSNVVGEQQEVSGGEEKVEGEGQGEGERREGEMEVHEEGETGDEEEGDEDDDEEEILEWGGFTEDGEQYFIEVDVIAESLTRTLKHIIRARHMLEFYGAVKTRDAYLAFQDTFIVDSWSTFQIACMVLVGTVQVWMIKKLFASSSRQVQVVQKVSRGYHS